MGVSCHTYHHRIYDLHKYLNNEFYHIFLKIYKTHTLKLCTQQTFFWNIYFLHQGLLSLMWQSQLCLPHATSLHSSHIYAASGQSWMVKTMRRKRKRKNFMLAPLSLLYWIISLQSKLSTPVDISGWYHISANKSQNFLTQQFWNLFYCVLLKGIYIWSNWLREKV